MKIVKTGLRNRINDELLNDFFFLFWGKKLFEKVTNDVVHVEDEPEIGEFHQDPDSDSSGDDDSETE